MRSQTNREVVTIRPGAGAPSHLRSVLAAVVLSIAGLVMMQAAFTLPATASPANRPTHQTRVGSFLYNTKADFLAACTVLPDVLKHPHINQLTVSPAKGGELRLQASLEDYFEDVDVYSTKWISGYSNPAYPGVEMPQIIDGQLRLDANYLRARQPFAAETPVRFFEASARFVTAPDPVAYADIGFYRSLPPLQAVTETSSIRLFVAQTATEAAIPRHFFVRSKDGEFIPSEPATTNAIDTAVDNWGANSSAQMSGLNQFRTYTILWDQAETQYWIDGSVIMTTAEGTSAPLPHRGISTLPTYAFLYSQDPTFIGGGRSPLLVDWVRAGAYAAQGSYTSSVLDAGEVVNWSRIALSAEIPEDAEIVVETRTSYDGAVWSDWSAGSVAGSGASTLSMDNPGGRYAQYRVDLRSASALFSPELLSLELFTFGAKSLRANPDKAFVNPGQQMQFSADVLDANDEPIRAYQVPVEWSVVYGGGTIDSNGLFTAGAISGRFTDTVQVNTPGLLLGTATVSVGSAPEVAVAFCCHPEEGVPITLTAQFDQSIRASLSTFEWDVDGDGIFGDLMGESVVHIFPKTGEYEVGLRVTNALGFTNTVQTTTNVINVAPQITAVLVDTPARPRAPITVTVQAFDVPTAILSYAFDLDNDGIFEVPDQLSNQTTATFDAPGAYTIGVRVRDDDGAETLGSSSIQVEQFQLFLPTIER